MKILTGSLKGRTLRFSSHSRLRPTSNKVRKAIFDKLQGLVEGSRVLDLFSGTGALGMEALSRGAGAAVFVERHPAQCRKIRENLKTLGLERRGLVIRQDALSALRHLGRRGEHFDLIFADPPYGRGGAMRVLGVLALYPGLCRGGWVVLECGKGEPMPEHAGSLERADTRIHGDSQTAIYRVA